MRDILYRNLTSGTKGRKRISTSEVTDKEGVHSVIRRHFACIAKEIKQVERNCPQPSLYMVKEHDSKEQRERFFCKIKGNLLLKKGDKLYRILYLHSLQINLTTLQEKNNTN